MGETASPSTPPEARVSFQKETFERRRESDLNCGLDERPNFRSAWNPINYVLELSFDFIGQPCRSIRNLSLRDVHELSPLDFGAVAENLCRGLDERI